MPRNIFMVPRQIESIYTFTLGTQIEIDEWRLLVSIAFLLLQPVPTSLWVLSRRPPVRRLFSSTELISDPLKPDGKSRAVSDGPWMEGLSPIRRESSKHTCRGSGTNPDLEMVSSSMEAEFYGGKFGAAVV